ncbi:MAG TPA: DUF58 domain-containing protein [Phycisphaeraceae bacterium]
MKAQRIRTQVGPGGVVYLMLTALILGVAIYTQANLLFWAFGLMVGGLAVSWLGAWRALRGLEVQRLLPAHGVAGEPVVLRYQLVNRSWLPMFSLVIVETWGKGRRGWKKSGPIAQDYPQLRNRPHGWVLHLGPHQMIQAEAPCWPMRRGPLRFERIVVSTTFPFGIFRKVAEFHQPGAVLIYPQLHRLNRRFIGMLWSLDPSGQRQVDRGGGTEEFYGLRPYRLGDNLKMVAWRHSARTGQLISRDMTHPSPPRLMLLLDLEGHTGSAAQSAESASRGRRRWRRKRRGQESQPPPAELAISLAASLICEAYLHGYQIGLAVAGTPAPVFPIHHSLPHRTRMLEALARLDLNEQRTAPEAGLVRPTLIVRPDESSSSLVSRSGLAAGAVVLGAAQMDRYIAQGAVVSARLLQQRGRAPSQWKRAMKNENPRQGRAQVGVG